MPKKVNQGVKTTQVLEKLPFVSFSVPFAVLLKFVTVDENPTNLIKQVLF